VLHLHGGYTAASGDGPMKDEGQHQDRYPDKITGQARVDHAYSAAGKEEPPQDVEPSKQKPLDGGGERSDTDDRCNHGQRDKERIADENQGRIVYEHERDQIGG